MSLIGIAELILSRITDTALTRLSQRIHLDEKDFIIQRRTDHKESLYHHLNGLGNWASEISFRDLKQSKQFRDTFVDLDLTLGQANSRAAHPLKVSDLTLLPGHFVLLGDPGSGKTTSLKKVAFALLQEPNLQQNGHVPLLIELRDFSPEESISGRLSEILGVVVSYTKEALESAVGKGQLTAASEKRVKDTRLEAITKRVLTESLENLRCVLLIDGLDELNPRAREAVVAELRYYLRHVTRARIIITCRTADYVYHFENATSTTLQPLEPAQIEEFAIRWLGHARAMEFLSEVHASLQRVGGTAAHTCPPLRDL
jgi:predicted NACHT family NTPase